jgi:hypothetical protein
MEKHISGDHRSCSWLKIGRVKEKKMAVYDWFSKYNTNFVTLRSKNIKPGGF